MENYAKEIHDLHQFFQEYLLGNLDPEPMTYFENVLAKSFTIITAEGAIIDHDGIVGYVRNGHAQRPSFRIWTENIALRQHIGDIVVVSYEEWQSIADTTTTRTSTAIFKEDSSARNGLIWLHVHESGLRTIETK